MEKGAAAEALLESEAFKTVVETLLQEQFAVFQSTDPYDDKGREKCHSYAVSIGGIKTKLENWAAERKMELEKMKAETYGK
jgi:hypothetical protein